MDIQKTTVILLYFSNPHGNLYGIYLACTTIATIIAPISPGLPNVLRVTGSVNWTYLIKKKQHCNLIVSKILLIKSPSEKKHDIFLEANYEHGIMVVFT